MLWRRSGGAWAAQAAAARRAARRTGRGVEGWQRGMTAGRMPLPPVSGVMKIEGQERMRWRQSMTLVRVLLVRQAMADVTRERRGVVNGR
jgi:hypothetical protein